ncbi:MAG: hypothetical protein AMXMBFR8_26910 [Nevskiales bacterium]
MENETPHKILDLPGALKAVPFGHPFSARSDGATGRPSATTPPAQPQRARGSAATAGADRAQRAGTDE